MPRFIQFDLGQHALYRGYDKYLVPVAPMVGGRHVASDKRNRFPYFFASHPGLLLVVEFIAPEHLSPRKNIVPGSRDEKKHDMNASCCFRGLSVPTPTRCVYWRSSTFF